jgi:hypothetical protein
MESRSQGTDFMRKGASTEISHEVVVRFPSMRFQLDERGAETKRIFDHTGFPEDRAVHQAPGWWSHYWEPLEKYPGCSGQRTWAIR